MWITNSGFADLFTVFAKVDGEKFSAFLIERNTPGFSVGAEEHKLGIRGSSTCPLILADCQVPVENLLGEVGKGHHIAFNILNIGRFKLGAACVGGARNGLQNAIQLRQGAQGVRQVDRRIRPDPGEAGRMRRRHLRRRIHGLPHHRHDRRGPGRRRYQRRRRLPRDPEAHRGVCRGVLHPQGLGVGDAGHGGGPRRADLRRLRLRGGVSRRARLSRFAHQPHLRRHQRDQPPDHHRLADEARRRRASCRCCRRSRS